MDRPNGEGDAIRRLDDCRAPRGEIFRAIVAGQFIQPLAQPAEPNLSDLEQIIELVFASPQRLDRFLGIVAQRSLGPLRRDNLIEFAPMIGKLILDFSDCLAQALNARGRAAAVQE